MPVVHASIPVLLMSEADEATDRHTCSCLARPDCCELPINHGPSSARRGSYGHSPRLWGCAGAVLTNPGPCHRHGMMEQRSRSPGCGARKQRASPGSQSQDRGDNFVQMHPGRLHAPSPAAYRQAPTSGPLASRPRSLAGPKALQMLPRTAGWSRPNENTRVAYA